MCILCISDPLKIVVDCERSDETWTTALIVNEDIGDAPITSATPYSVISGDSFNGELAPTGERDWIELTLSADEIVTITMTGNTLSDPFLRLRDASGTLVASNDDFVGLDSQLSYRSDTGGTFYIEAGSYNDTGGGTYTIEVGPLAPYDPLDSLDWGGATVPGTGSSGGTIDVYFATTGETFDGVTADVDANAYEIGQFQMAFDMIESYTNLNFNIVGSSAGADFTIVLDNNQISALGFFNPPGTTGAGVGVFSTVGTGWDRTAGGGLEEGGYGYVTIIHEIGHGLGLAHPHDTGGGSEILPGVSDPFSDVGVHELNQGVYTTMSYVDGFVAGPTGTVATTNDYGYQGTFMALDLGLLQPRYGYNMSTGAGNDAYVLPDSNASGTFYEAIWDASGDDTISYSGGSNATIDLRAATLMGDFGGGGYISGVDGIQGGYTIANGVVIENGHGGSGNDSITGNNSNNELLGGAGFDTLNGLNGNDSLDGGDGNDSVNGGNGNDTIIDSSGFDTLNGEGGDDLFVQVASAVLADVDGGTGTDTYDASAETFYAITFDLATGTMDDTFTLSDFLNMENVIGTQVNDTILGNAEDNVLDGQGGDDSITGGGGEDSLLGGDGNDTIIGSSQSNAVGDTIDGGSGDDFIEGSSGSDSIIGGTGNDSIDGGIGADTIEAGTGNDYVAPRGGFDLVQLGGGDDTVFGLGGDDTLQGQGGNDVITGGGQNDNIAGGAGLDTIRGGNGFDSILGGDDNDRLFGGASSDTIDGGDGDDRIEGEDGNDVIIGGAGNDRMFGGNQSDDFVFADGFGQDTIVDFDATDNAEDIDLSAVSAITDFADLAANHMSQVGANVVIDDGAGNTIRLEGVMLADLGNNDFIF